MNDLLKRLADVDPESAKELHRYQKWTRVLAAIAIVAVLGTGYAIAVNVDQGNDITKVTQKVNSSCTQVADHPITVSDEVRGDCEHTRQEIAREEGLEGPCILHQRATGTKGANCTKVYVPLDGEPASGGDASQPGSTGHQQPSPPHKGGHTGDSIGGSHEGSPAPEQHPGTKAKNPPAEAPASTTSEEVREEPSPSSETEAAPATKQPVREAVGQVGETVNGALEGVGDTGCKLLGCKNP